MPVQCARSVARATYLWALTPLRSAATIPTCDSISRWARWCIAARTGDISEAADSRLGVCISVAPSNACARVLPSCALAGVDAAVLAVVVATNSGHVAVRARVRGPDDLVVLAAEAAGLFGLKLGYSVEAGANGEADAGRMDPGAVCGFGATSDGATEAEV